MLSGDRDLRRGDVIHLAVPLNTGPGGENETRNLVDQVTQNYARQGVHVAVWTAGTLTAHATVVAVFREE